MLAVIEARATAASRASEIHGPRHWLAVARVAMELAQRTPSADARLGFWFGAFHDAQRLHDGHDPDHGRRAAAMVQEFAGAGLLDLSPERLGLLAQACAGHADGLTSADPTIGTCWDADRLNLCRVGLAPARQLLSTADGPLRLAEVMERGVGSQEVGEG